MKKKLGPEYSIYNLDYRGLPTTKATEKDFTDLTRSIKKFANEHGLAKLGSNRPYFIRVEDVIDCRIEVTHYIDGNELRVEVSFLPTDSALAPYINEGVTEDLYAVLGELATEISTLFHISNTKPVKGKVKIESATGVRESSKLH